MLKTHVKTNSDSELMFQNIRKYKRELSSHQSLPAGEYDEVAFNYYPYDNKSSSYAPSYTPTLDSEQSYEFSCVSYNPELRSYGKYSKYTNSGVITKLRV